MNDVEIMVVKKDILFKDLYFQGFLDAEKFNFYDLILKNYQFLPRSTAEKNYDYKQPIAYGVLINHKNEIYAYQRAIKNYNEERLKGLWSIGIGGHIEKVDTNDSQDPILVSFKRELIEEVKIDGDVSFQLLGYINDDTNDVGMVHFGVLFLLKTDALHAQPNDKESKIGRFVTLNELNKIVDFLEGWSKITYKLIKKKLNKLN